MMKRKFQNSMVVYQAKNKIFLIESQDFRVFLMSDFISLRSWLRVVVRSGVVELCCWNSSFCAHNCGLLCSDCCSHFSTLIEVSEEINIEVIPVFIFDFTLDPKLLFLFTQVIFPISLHLLVLFVLLDDNKPVFSANNKFVFGLVSKLDLSSMSSIVWLVVMVGRVGCG